MWEREEEVALTVVAVQNKDRLVPEVSEVTLAFFCVVSLLLLDSKPAVNLEGKLVLERKSKEGTICVKVSVDTEEIVSLSFPGGDAMKRAGGALRLWEDGLQNFQS